MKNLKIYVIADIVSETILSVFSAISEDMAFRQFHQALDGNKDKIYDPDSIRLFTVVGNEGDFNLKFIYAVPETYDEIHSYFVDITDAE